ncbi:MAG: bile acid:sodium symporter family protein [Gammaproteobacteria bacterium]
MGGRRRTCVGGAAVRLDLGRAFGIKRGGIGRRWCRGRGGGRGPRRRDTQTIDQAQFQFDPRAGIVIGVLVAIMVFGVALDLRWEHFRRILKDPRAPIVGLFAQFVVLPAIALAISHLLVRTPSVALGLLLVASVPGGAVSNYMTYLARGDVATSVAITAVTTLGCIIITPLLFGVLASANPATAGLLRQLGVSPAELILMFMFTVGLPIAGGMLLAARRPRVADRIRVWIRRLSMILFAVAVVTGTAVNIGLLVRHASESLLPAVLACALALAVGWTSSKLAGLGAADRRAVTIEAGGQQAGVAIGIAITFFPSLAGVAVMCAVWGVVQVAFIVPLVAIWARMPPRTSGTSGQEV